MEFGYKKWMVCQIVQGLFKTLIIGGKVLHRLVGRQSPIADQLDDLIRREWHQCLKIQVWLNRICEAHMILVEKYERQRINIRLVRGIFEDGLKDDRVITNPEYPDDGSPRIAYQGTEVNLRTTAHQGIIDR